MRRDTDPASRFVQTPAPLPPDTHEAQADRVAAFCADHPGRFYTAAELARACDLGCASKVLSEMCGRLAYGVAKEWRTVPVASGTHVRRVRIYRVTHGPRGEQPDLFAPE